MTTEQDNKLSTTPTTTKPLSNVEKAKLDAFAELREIGRSEGKGKTARLRAAEFVTQKAKEGLFDENDNRQAWQEVISGAGDELVEYGGNDVRETQQFKQRASDIKHFIILGRNKTLDGPLLLANARKRMMHLRSTGMVKSGRIWELLLAFARNQNAQAKTALSEKEIDKVMADKATKAKKKDLAEKFYTEREKLVKLNEGYDYPAIYTACSLLDDVVKELGGTKKQKAEAKEKAKQDKIDAARKATDVKSKTQPVVTKTTPPPVKS